MQKLAERNITKLLDMLTARVVYERTGVRLYDSVIAKIEHGRDPRYERILGTLREHRDQEKAHEEWLEEQIRRLGGSPHVQTAQSRLEEEESQGIQRVILDGHTDLSHNLHALLTAELADNAGWDLLVKLADEAGDREAKAEFERRLRHEMQHMVFLREVVKRVVEGEVLGEERGLPERPSSALRSAARRSLGMGAVFVGLAGAFAAVLWSLASRRKPATGRTLRRRAERELGPGPWGRLLGRRGGVERLREMTD